MNFPVILFSLLERRIQFPRPRRTHTHASLQPAKCSGNPGAHPAGVGGMGLGAIIRKSADGHSFAVAAARAALRIQ